MPVDEGPLEGRLYDVPPPLREPQPPTVQSTSSRPAPSSDAPGIGGTSGQEESSGGEAADPPPEFDERYRDEFTGVMFIGALKDSFTWLGHTFKIRTLKTDEFVEIGLLVKPYEGTASEIKALQAATVAGCVLSVDGRPLPQAISSDPSQTDLSLRFEYVMKHWYAPTLDVVYERYYILELRVRELLDAMGNRSG
jgi:hypothetical protein